jgi:hypothetical protein
VLSYTYDRAGQLVGKQESVDGTGAGTNWRYTYDGLRQLTQVEEQSYAATDPEEGEPFVVIETYG